MDFSDFGEGIQKAGDGVSTALEGVRFLITGDYPPETIEALKQLELELLKVSASLQLGQVEINKIEAKSDSKFKSWWRPAIGWIGVFGLSYVFIIQPMLIWVMKIILFFYYPDLKNEEIELLIPPNIDAMLLFNLVGALLGIGGYRTYEKFKGVTK